MLFRKKVIELNSYRVKEISSNRSIVLFIEGDSESSSVTIFRFFMTILFLTTDSQIMRIY